MGCFHSWANDRGKTHSTKIDPKLPGIDPSQKFTEDVGCPLHGCRPLQGEIIKDVRLDIFAASGNGATVNDLIDLF